MINNEFENRKLNIINKVKKDPFIFKSLAKEYRADKDIVMATIVRKFWDYYQQDLSNVHLIHMFKQLEMFKYADSKLKNDKEFVLQLMLKCSGYLYRYLPVKMRRDKEIAYYMIDKIGYDYVSRKYYRYDERGEDVNFLGIKVALEEDPIISYVDKSLLTDKKFVRKLIKNDPLSVIHVNVKFLKGDKFIRKIIEDLIVEEPWAEESLKEKLIDVL